MPDIIGSVANYLHRHGWELGQPVTYPAVMSSDADKSLVTKRDFKVKTPVSVLAEAGIEPSQAVPAETLAVVGTLEEEDGDHYFVTFKNFYVITRYNRSPLYAMAVYELSEAIRGGFGQ
jgi:membrane-bound lytic murein transglycosylase B